MSNLPLLEGHRKDLDIIDVRLYDGEPHALDSRN